MTRPRLLIVDDDEDICTQMKWALAEEYEVLMAGDRPDAVAAFTAGRPTVTLLDLGLPPRPNDPDEGLAVLSGLLALDPLAKVIIVSGQGDKQNLPAIRLVKGRLRPPLFFVPLPFPGEERYFFWTIGDFGLVARRTDSTVGR